MRRMSTDRSEDVPENVSKPIERWRDRCVETMKEWVESAREALESGREVPPPPPIPRMPDLPPQPPMPGMPPRPPRPPPPPPRSNVIASRIGDEELGVVDMLIEAGVFGTRSEAVAYLVREGIRARKDVVEEVSSALHEIRKIARQKEEYASRLRKEIGILDTESASEGRK